ncbi:hypothetical protein MLD38_023764 [Melastoma candidum]|uniref:Uncharacterized protein n=1 Tax=Melastoma candidum TaxID=119954 RepID=A0ACB9NR97_9MYRT|nr:hypothetical protein MLD38_023764 [Melastoma candidum]
MNKRDEKLWRQRPIRQSANTSLRMGCVRFGPAAFVFVLCCLKGVMMTFGDTGGRRYKAGNDVPLYVNKVGPFANPSETYEYYSLPLCRPDVVERKKMSFGELLNGERFATAPFKIAFLQDKDHEVACRRNISVGEVLRLQSAMRQDYYYQMDCDDLPMWGFLGGWLRGGEDGQQKFRLYQHLEFQISYNKDQIIDAHVRMHPYSRMDLTDQRDTYIELSYGVKWVESNDSYSMRMDKYKWRNPFHSAMQRNSILGSCWTLLILITSLSLYYVRVVRKDFSEFSTDDLVANHEQKGWKYLCFDVFRYPPNKSLLSAFLGYGAQLCTLVVLLLLLGLLGLFYPYKHGNLLKALVFGYSTTSAVAGYISISLFHRLEGTDWVKNLILLGCISYGPLLLSFCFNNTVATAYQANAALPFTVVSKLLLIVTCVALPLLALGGLAARKLNRPEFQVPCEPSKCPREIPPIRWYKKALPRMILGGFLPFSVVCIELYFLYASLWGYRVYTAYGVLAVNFVILLVTTCAVTVSLTHSQLASEDHHWWWRSFLVGGSGGLYIFGYSIFYYYCRTNFSGFLQLSFFFGYTACISFGLFAMLGSVGFFSSLVYVRHIYGSIKSD